MNALGEPAWAEMVGHEIVLDLASPYVVLGRLVAARDDFLELENVDVHDLRDTQSTREKYILDCRLHGVRPNRGRAWISLHELVTVSKLADVLID
jgi:hypothetical protein